MATMTKKELIDRVAGATKVTRVSTKNVIQTFLDNVIVELAKGNRLELRNFGVFEVKGRGARMARNPHTEEKVHVPPKYTVKFKPGQMMKKAVGNNSDAASLDFGDADPKSPTGPER